MKKAIVILFVLFSFASFAQPGRLDTVSVSLTMKASEWAYYASYLNGSTDSADIAFLRTLRNQVQATQNVTWNTNITVTTGGRYVVAIYDIGRRMPAAEALQLGTAALNTISAINNAVIQYWVGQIDAQHTGEFIRKRTLGKNLLID